MEMTRNREGGRGDYQAQSCTGATIAPRSPAASTTEKTSAQYSLFQLPADFSTEVCPSRVFTSMVINCLSFSSLPPHHTHSLGPFAGASPSLCGFTRAGCQPVHIHALSLPPVTSLHGCVCSWQDLQSRMPTLTVKAPTDASGLSACSPVSRYWPESQLLLAPQGCACTPPAPLASQTSTARSPLW